MAKRKADSKALGALLAAGIGYVIGILTAPKSGRETREQIKQTAKQAKAESEKRLKAVYSELDQLISDGRQKAAQATAVAKKELTGAVDKAEKARDKARTILSAVHEGEAEDKDLDKAIKESKIALEHLKQYLKIDDKKTE